MRQWAPRGALVLGASAGSVLLAATAAGAGSNLVTYGDFSQPGTNATTPSNWTPENFGVENDPYAVTFYQWNAAGQYPPPAGAPSTWAAEAFYEAGRQLGVEGFGATQPLSISSGLDPQLSWSDVQTNAPEATNAD